MTDWDLRFSKQSRALEKKYKITKSYFSYFLFPITKKDISLSAEERKGEQQNLNDSSFDFLGASNIAFPPPSSRPESQNHLNSELGINW